MCRLVPPYQSEWQRGVYAAAGPRASGPPGGELDEHRDMGLIAQPADLEATLRDTLDPIAPRAMAVLDRPMRVERSTWLTRALAVSSDRMRPSIRSMSTRFESCAICLLIADIRRDLSISPQDRRISNRGPW